MRRHDQGRRRGAVRGRRQRSGSTTCDGGIGRAGRTRPRRVRPLSSSRYGSDQRSAVAHDGVHHGVPVTAQVLRDLSDGSTVVANLKRRPPARPIGDRRTRIGDAVINLDERHHTARRVGATPPLLRPHQTRSTAKARQIDEFDLETIMHPYRPVAARTHRPFGTSRDRDPQKVRPVADADNVDVGQANEQLAHARRVGLQQGLLEFWMRQTHPDSSSPCPRPRTLQLPQPTPRSEAPVIQGRGAGARHRVGLAR